jgi:ribosomal protein S18 acetylase RimI-like enzyme
LAVTRTSLDGVADEVEEHLGEAQLVAKAHRKRLVHKRRERELLVLCQRLGGRAHRLDDALDGVLGPAVLVPLKELMNEARDTWYVHVLATYPEYRGRGQGTALLGIADGFAERASKPALSLIVSDTNVDARRLYERCGYVEVALRRMVKEEWQHPGAAWLLLKKNY